MVSTLLSSYRHWQEGRHTSLCMTRCGTRPHIGQLSCVMLQCLWASPLVTSLAVTYNHTRCSVNRRRCHPLLDFHHMAGLVSLHPLRRWLYI